MPGSPLAWLIGRGGEWPGAKLPALIAADGDVLSFGELHARVASVADRLLPKRGLLVLECASDAQTVIAYLAGLRARCPVLMVAEGREDTIDAVTERFRPGYVWRAGHSEPAGLGAVTDELHDDLALLLSTSGSTGAAKLIRLSYSNLISNAESIAEYLELREDDRAPAILPFNYSYGLSVLNSHLFAGASIYLSRRSVAEPAFWQEFRAFDCTNFAGVPHIYQILDRSDFSTRQLPKLRHATQAGGRLHPGLVMKIGQMAARDGWRFFVMYGQTEATARMSYLPPEEVLRHPDCIGVPIPGGCFRLDEAGDGDAELVYSGPNVMMGYALEAADLARGPELSELRTGDLAQRTTEGFYRIVGRKSRFIKPFGLRIGLDDVERRLADQGVETACVGDNEMLAIFCVTSDPSPIATSVAEWLQLPASSVVARPVDAIPLQANGKTDYRALEVLRDLSRIERAADEMAYATDVAGLFGRTFPGRGVQPQDSFTGLGGDSLLYVQFSIELENLIGPLPANWENLTLEELDAVKPANRGSSSMDMSTLLRCVAIVLVVCGHLRLFDYGGGGAFLLLMLGGYSFGRFIVSRVIETGSVAAVLKLIRWIALPTMLYLMMLQIAFHEFIPQTILLISNWINPHLSPHGFAYWFVNVYVQILAILCLVLSFRNVREFIANNRMKAVAILFGLSVVLHVTGGYVWNTDPLYNRLPHMLLWLFVGGWLLYSGRSVGHGYVPLVLLMLASFFLIGPSGQKAIIIASAVLLLGLPRLSLPRLGARVVSEIAAASLFIYLTHFQFASLATHLGLKAPALQVLVALIGGSASLRSYEAIRGRLIGRVNLRRSISEPQAAQF